MWLQKLLTVGLCLTTLSLIISACAPAAAPTPKPAVPTPTKAPVAETPAPKPAIPTPSPKPAAEQPRYGGVLTMAQLADPPNFDMHQNTTTGPMFSTVGSSYNQLIQRDHLAWPEDKIIPDLAERWEVSGDGLVYTFHLRKGVKFHDGKPFSSADVKISLDRHYNPPRGVISPRGDSLQSIAKTETPDENTLRVTLKYPQAAFLGILSTGWLVIYPKHVLEAKGDMKKDVLGTGPFKFKSHAPGVAYESVKNPDYFHKGRPYLDGCITYIIPDAGTRLAALRTKRVLFIPAIPNIGASGAEIVRKSGLPIEAKAAITSMLVLGMNMAREPWNDVRLRRAVNLVFDRDQCIELIGGGEGMVGGLMHPQGPWSLPGEELRKMPGYRRPKDVDISEAKRLVAEVALPKGFKTTILTRKAMPESERLGEVANEYLRKYLDIDVTVIGKESASYYAALEKRDIDLHSSTLGLGTDDPDVVFAESYITGAARNYEGYSNPRVDELFAKQSRSMDVAERKKLTLEMQRLVMDDSPRIMVLWLARIVAHWSEVRNWKPGPVVSLSFSNWQDIWLAK